MEVSRCSLFRDGDWHHPQKKTTWPVLWGVVQDAHLWQGRNSCLDGGPQPEPVEGIQLVHQRLVLHWLFTLCYRVQNGLSVTHLESNFYFQRYNHLRHLMGLPWVDILLFVCQIYLLLTFCSPLCLFRYVYCNYHVGESLLSKLRTLACLYMGNSVAHIHKWWDAKNFPDHLFKTLAPLPHNTLYLASLFL